MQAEKRLTFTEYEKIDMPAWGFREGTPGWPMSMNFIFLNGGMGDYICWMTAIRWLAECATWINGTLVCPNYFIELAEYWLKPYKNWKFKTYNELKDLDKPDDTPFRGPVVLQQESLNATGAHLLTCGWVYFTNKEGPPPGWENYSHIVKSDLDKVKLPFELPEKFAVITTGVTTNTRKSNSAQWNYIIEYIHSKGLTPVFLGKRVVTTGNARNIHTKWDEGFKFDLGLDLRDKTTLMQAAAVISRAKLIVGHDNGLLHLAGCTETPIVFGYSLASPEHRRPKRPAGKIYDVTLTDQELACNHCQSKTNFVIGYNFRECYYGDNLCMKMLFENEAIRWKRQIDRALAESM